jgi:drug/metabolite transporter (DMT)-like permease
MSSRTKALIAILISSIFFSSAGMAKIVVRIIDPYTVAFLRFFIASVVILPIFVREKNKGKHLVRDLVPLSLFCAGNIACYYIGLTTSTANAGTLIYAGLPLVTAVLANQFLHETLRFQRIVGISIGLCGVTLIALLPLLEKGAGVTGSLPGNIFFFLAILVFPMYTILSRRAIATQGYSPITITGVSLFTTAAVFFVISLFTFNPRQLPQLVQPNIIILLLYLGIFVTALSYLLYQWAVKHSSATTVSLSSNLQPVFAIILNIIFLGESITPMFLLGGAIVISGVAIAGGGTMWREMRGWVRL